MKEIKQPGAWEFAQALVKEANGHVGNGDWELIPFSKVPERVEPVPFVWVMFRRDLVSNQVTKYKTWLNMHGRKQELGMEITSLHKGYNSADKKDGLKSLYKRWQIVWLSIHQSCMMVSGSLLITY